MRAEYGLGGDIREGTPRAGEATMGAPGGVHTDFKKIPE